MIFLGARRLSSLQTRRWLARQSAGRIRHAGRCLPRFSSSVWLQLIADWTTRPRERGAVGPATRRRSDLPTLRRCESPATRRCKLLLMHHLRRLADSVYLEVFVAGTCASVAQSAEQLICNQQVVGSSPSASSCRRIEPWSPPWVTATVHGEMSCAAVRGILENGSLVFGGLARLLSVLDSVKRHA